MFLAVKEQKHLPLSFAIKTKKIITLELRHIERNTFARAKHCSVSTELKGQTNLSTFHVTQRKSLEIQTWPVKNEEPCRAKPL